MLFSWLREMPILCVWHRSIRSLKSIIQHCSKIKKTSGWIRNDEEIKKIPAGLLTMSNNSIVVLFFVLFFFASLQLWQLNESVHVFLTRFTHFIDVSIAYFIQNNHLEKTGFKTVANKIIAKYNTKRLFFFKWLQFQRKKKE